jgi:NAD-dependent DNA ligase
MRFIDRFLKGAAPSAQVPPSLSSEFRELGDRPFRPALDEHGQPVIRGYNESRRIDRAVDEMIGLLRGIIASGSVTPAAIIELAKWLLRNQEAATTWPVSAVVNEVGPALGTRRITERDCERLHSLFLQITGPDAGLYENAATGLPLTDPAPDVKFAGRVFVFTGKFRYGSRRVCRAAVVERGGAWEENITRETSYVVIGAIGSADWVHSVYGRKIEHAVQLRESGHPWQ